jgi:hypothetical protein
MTNSRDDDYTGFVLHGLDFGWFTHAFPSVQSVLHVPRISKMRLFHVLHAGSFVEVPLCKMPDIPSTSVAR